jgi:hypothetical protein
MNAGQKQVSFSAMPFLSGIAGIPQSAEVSEQDIGQLNRVQWCIVHRKS